MFFIFGFGPKQEEVGPGLTRTCVNCNNTAVWRRIRESKRFTLFFIPIARWGKREFEACPICGYAVPA
ncbi:zinc-ribbon domain-containing protein [Agrococcus lahaulensis]|uniref:zinc-ribbon domain-containing protein n=1 Tax=Agrococcus lahaulensis TaxID=341722 RepID=UPI0004216FAB|nr:zinc-ribbon domain-containing protein [Agrococcus lahaulensis]